MKESQIIHDFRIELKSVRGLADNTCKIYCQEVTSFLAFIRSRARTVRSAARDDLIAWRESMSDRADSGIALAVSAVRALFKHLDIADHFPEFRVSIKEQEITGVPTCAQFLAMRQKLRSPVTDPRCVPSITRQAILETLAGAALRIGALTTIRRRHLHLDDAKPYLHIEADVVSCKGKFAGMIPLSPYCASVLAQHCDSLSLGSDDLVFDLSESVIRKIIDQVAPEGLSLSPHSLRHFGCSMTYYRNYDGGRNDPVWVRDFAAHSSIATTDRYLKMARRVCQSDEEWMNWAIGG